MFYLTVGATGFISVLFYDLAQMRGKRGAAAAFSIIGYGCILASIVFLISNVRPANTPFTLLLLKILVAAAFLVLLIYSVLFEIPRLLHRSRSSKRAGRQVVAEGFYGVVRHPGFLWFALLWVSIALIYLNPMVTAVAIGLVVLDLLLVIVEDTLVFPRIFAGYDQYKRRVPFLIPRLRRR